MRLDFLRVVNVRKTIFREAKIAPVVSLRAMCVLAIFSVAGCFAMALLLGLLQAFALIAPPVLLFTAIVFSIVTSTIWAISMQVVAVADYRHAEELLIALRRAGYSGEEDGDVWIFRAKKPPRFWRGECCRLRVTETSIILEAPLVFFKRLLDARLVACR